MLPILKSLPQNAGSIRKITSPTKSSGRTVVYIQDVHRNREAQQNIGKAVQELINNRVVDVVALEGAFTPMDFSWYHACPHRDAINAMADWLLKENRISGPAYAALTAYSKSQTLNSQFPLFVGVDQKDHYDANVRAYRAAAPLVASYRKVFEQKTRELDEIKNSALNPALKKFAAQMEAYRNNSLSWGDYVLALTKQTTFSSKVQTYLTAMKMEGELNFNEVERERTALLSRLVQKLNSYENNELFNYSAGYQSGALSHADFYIYLQELCAKKELSLSRSPAMDEYIRYVLLSESLDIDSILKETTSMEKRVYDQLTKTNQESELIKRARVLYLTEKLLGFALTTEEWKEFRNTRPLKSLTSFESFYREAELRDEAMAKNLEKAMDNSHAHTAVLVTGGFHSEGLTRFLQSKNITVVSYVPNISKIESANGSAYLSVFSQEKTPLDKLFAGEKLFLANDPMIALPGGKRLAAATYLSLRANGRGEVPVSAVKKLVVTTVNGAIVSVLVVRDVWNNLHIVFKTAIVATASIFVSILIQSPSPLHLQNSTALIVLLGVMIAHAPAQQVETPAIPSSVFSNVCVSMSMMNLGSYQAAHARLRLLKQLGVGIVYFAAANQPSESSKKIHYTEVPTKEERFIEHANYMIRVINYETGHVQFGDLKLDDRRGSHFSTTGELNSALAKENADAEFIALLQEAHKPENGHALKVVVDFIPRFPPDAINEKNYKWTEYKETGLHDWSDKERIKNLLRENPGMVRTKNNGRCDRASHIGTSSLLRPQR